MEYMSWQFLLTVVFSLFLGFIFSRLILRAPKFISLTRVSKLVTRAAPDESDDEFDEETVLEEWIFEQLRNRGPASTPRVTGFGHEALHKFERKKIAEDIEIADGVEEESSNEVCQFEENIVKIDQ
ncbi:hypothetical protein Scep_001124 [Stephania cephalantha]|uniref:Uncharacterized protein n=1 Tax=Stephania cephalantha TaxID=152367 RepID=A0AAP0L8S0_9MAGN